MRYQFEIEITGLCLLVRNWKEKDDDGQVIPGRDRRCRVLFLDARTKADSLNSKGTYKNPEQGIRAVFDPKVVTLSPGAQAFDGGDGGLRSAPLQGTLEVGPAPNGGVWLFGFDGDDNRVTSLNSAADSMNALRDACGDDRFDNCTKAFAHLEIAGGSLEAIDYEETWTFVDSIGIDPVTTVQNVFLAQAFVWHIATEGRVLAVTSSDGTTVTITHPGGVKAAALRLSNLPTQSYKAGGQKLLFDGPRPAKDIVVDYYYERFYEFFSAPPRYRAIPRTSGRKFVLAEQAPRCAPAQYP